MSTISIRGLNKADVLAALYNASHPLGMGFMQYDATPMTREEAQTLLDNQTYFDYLKGRVMKTDLSDDHVFDSWGYDRDIGNGAAEKVIAELRASGDVQTDSISAIHESGKSDAAEVIRATISKPSTFSSEGGVAMLELGLDDVADVLSEAVDRAT